MKKYFLRIYGCQMNYADAERVEGWYQNKGWKAAEKIEEADEIVIVSCSVRESAENRVFGLVNNLNKIKSQRSNIKDKDQNLKILRPRIILTGCMLRYSPRWLREKLPNVDEFKKISEYQPKTKMKIRRKSGAANVLIMEGCNNFCTYCVVPYARGREISRPFAEIVCEVEELAKRGYKEITLLGQNVNSYGKDLIRSNIKYQISKIQSKDIKFKTMFANLLATLHEIQGIKKISFLTSNPWDLNEEIIKAMSLSKIDRYLHLPVQSGDNQILKKMNRKYTASNYLKLVEKIRNIIPEIKIGTDIIVGFPGETEEQFQNTVDLCKKVNFVKAYVSIYSPREQTAAYKMKEEIPFKEKRRRWKILNDLINRR